MSSKQLVTNLAKEFRPSLEGKKVLITGGAGFLGSWLVEVATYAGADVTCLDNLCTGKIENIKNLRVETIISDVEDATFSKSWDYVFHFASRASPEEYQKHPVETLKANSIGTLKMLELAKNSHSTFILASTSEIYGEPKIELLKM